MRQQGDLVLRAAGDVVLLGHLLARLAHRHAGRMFGDRRRDGGKVARPEAAEPLQPLAQRARLRERHELRRRALRKSERHVRQRLRAAGEHDLGLAAQDRLRAAGDGPIGGGAGEVHRGPGNRRRQRGAKDDLASEVRRMERRDDDTEDAQVDLGRVDRRPGDDLGGRDPRQIDDVELLQVAAGARERSATGIDDRHSPGRTPQLLARDAKHARRHPRRCGPPRPDRVGALPHLGRRRSVVRRRQRRGRLAQVWGRFRHRCVLPAQGYTKVDSGNAATSG